MPETNGQSPLPSDPPDEGRTCRHITFFAELKRRRVYRAGAAYLAVGEREQALDWLERAFDEEGGIYTLKDPHWDPLRNEPRFQVLWDRVGLPEESPPGAPSSGTPAPGEAPDSTGG